MFFQKILYDRSFNDLQQRLLDEIQQPRQLVNNYRHVMMMLGSKGILPPTDAYELLRCKAAPAIL